MVKAGGTITDRSYHPYHIKRCRGGDATREAKPTYEIGKSLQAD
jgi:hypothetical protein